ncbi:hypothetical protein [Thalassobacillus hwangdonensis]|uniref:Uncharacterized protein n=1 Tax=Thalassobacillus hwangdonensis TaxID=546108 RepID=A0ABW3L0M8_9BACI
MGQVEAKGQQSEKKDIFLYVIILIPILISTIETFFFEIFQGRAEYVYWYITGFMVLGYYLLKKEFKLFVVMAGIMLVAIWMYQL